MVSKKKVVEGEGAGKREVGREDQDGEVREEERDGVEVGGEGVEVNDYVLSITMATLITMVTCSHVQDCATWKLSSEV